MSETVNHPAHYGGADDPYEVIKVIEAWGFDTNAYLFNVLKYIKRDKGSTLEDLKKARWYLDRLITRLEGNPAPAPAPWVPKPAEKYLDKVGDLWIRNGDGTYDWNIGDGAGGVGLAGGMYSGWTLEKLRNRQGPLTTVGEEE